MRIRTPYNMLIALSLGLVGACSKEQFAGTPQTQSFTANHVEVYQNQTCAGHTLIKPPVDILYVVDNSLSAGLLTSSVKEQVRQTVQAVSQEFNYRILIAPLFPVRGSPMGENSLPVITNDATGIGKGTIINPDALDIAAFFSSTGGATSEAGFDRAVTVIDNYRSPGQVFRQGAHTIVVLVSNGDDTTVLNISGGSVSFNTTLFNQKVAAFNALKTNLNAQQLRFFSVVANSACQSGYKHGLAYRRMSCSLYAGSGATDQAGRYGPTACGDLAVPENFTAYSPATPDSYDLCSSAYTAMYAGVNASIRQEVLDHRYDYWPVTTTTTASINTSDIEVFKIAANGTTTAVPQSPSDGFQYVGALTNQNTRYFPSAGEPASGLFIRLFGNARVTYPECLVLRTSSPIETYQYVVLPTEPQTSTLIVRVRGAAVSQGGANGWTYEGFKTNQNIKQSGTPLLKTGYFVKLNGTSTYVSGDTVETFYTPAPI